MTVLCCMMPSTIALPIRQKNKDADGLIAVTADTDLGYKGTEDIWGSGQGIWQPERSNDGARASRAPCN